MALLALVSAENENLDLLDIGLPGTLPTINSL